MDADAIFTDAMAKFRQEMLDGGLSRKDYDHAASEAAIAIGVASIHGEHERKFLDKIREEPEEAAKLFQQYVNLKLKQDQPEPTQEPIADEDLTIDLDDKDGGGE
jgi:hypothetical protein